METPSEGVSGAGHARDITKLRDLAPVAQDLRRRSDRTIRAPGTGRISRNPRIASR